MSEYGKQASFICQDNEIPHFNPHTIEVTQMKPLLNKQLFFYCSISLSLLYKENNFAVTLHCFSYFVSVCLSPSLCTKPTFSAQPMGTQILFFRIKNCQILELKRKQIKIIRLNYCNFLL